MGIGLVALLWVFIWLTLRSSSKPRSSFSIYFRLVVSHVQLLMLVASFRFEWPGPVRSLLAVFESVADAPQQLFSLDCLFQEFGSASGIELPRFYGLLLVNWALPLGFAAGLALFWVLHLRQKLSSPDGWRTCRQKLTSSWLVAVFLVQPSVAAALFASFNCYSIDGATGSERGPFLLQELSERCWEGRHLSLVLSVGLSGLLLWVVGLPVWTGLVLREKRAQLGNESVRATYGFLYNGYAPRSYFWEVWGIVRKQLVAGVAVFLLRAGTLVQAFLLLLLLSLFLLASLRVRPFLRPLLNSLELFSLAALLLTVFAGLFYLAARDPASPAYLPGKDFSLS